ncbi:MAG TPA: energy transducer TonB [Bacteroides sp.]|nr:energy transducer TonB [Bacteroides sp.]
MSGKKKYRSAGDFLQYLKGAFSFRERHQFERDLEADPFAKEALEGLERISPDQAEEDLLNLYSRLGERMANKRPAGRKPASKRRIAVYSAAAAVAALLIVGTVFLRLYDFNPDQAEETLIGEEFPATAADTEAQSKPAEGETGMEEALLRDESVTGAEKALPREEPVTGAEDGTRKTETDAAAEEMPRQTASEDRIVHREAAPAEPVAGARSRDKSGTDDEVITEHAEVMTPERAQAPAPVPAPVTATPGKLTGMESRDTQPEAEKKGTHVEEVVMYDLAEFAAAESANQVVFLDEQMQPLETSSGAAPSTGFESFGTYARENLRFPDEDTTTRRAVVILRFTVTPEGTLRDIRPLRTPGEAYTREAERVLLEGPPWDPATEQEKKIEDQVRLRFVFKR